MLERDPKNINSVKGIAYLYLQMKKFEDAKTYYRKAIALILTIPSLTTRWRSSTGRRATSPAWKSAPRQDSSRTNGS